MLHMLSLERIQCENKKNYFIFMLCMIKHLPLQGCLLHHSYKNQQYTFDNKALENTLHYITVYDWL